MTDISELMRASGIDYVEAMDRFEDNEALYRKLAAKFVNDPHYAALTKALAEDDCQAAQRSAHSLKGVAGNLSFRDLYRAACEINDALNTGDIERAQFLMPQVREAYERVMSALNTLS